MCEATVTDEESAYRATYYSGVTSVKRGKLSCSSCGNTISFEADNYYAHPFLGILQCQPCCDQFRVLKSSLKVKAWKKRCLMCGSDHCQTLYPCPVKNCPYSFCKNCIKRNASSALLLADTTTWKCFVCLTNPLWEARGVCATLMSASPRRRKKQKTVREESSEDDDIDDIKAQMSKKSSKVSRVSKSNSSSSVRGRRPPRNASKSSANKTEEDSDDDIEVISVSKPKKSSKQRKTKSSRRKDSSERSSVERSSTPESSGRQSKLSTSHPTRRTRAGSSDSRKSTQRFTQRLDHVKRQNSDSSSGKEFTQRKIIKESYVTLQRLSVLEKDFTHSPDEPDSPVGTILSKQQVFSLKNSLQDFIHSLKSTSRRMMEAAESLQRQYSQKETIRPVEATKWIAECKNTAASFRKKIDDNEHTLVNKFGSWCKKTKIKNIFISTNGIDDSVTPSRSGLNNTKKGRGVVPSSSDEDEREVKSREKSSSVERTPEVSECESAEIFTQDEEAHSSKTKSKSRRRRGDKSLSPVDEEMNGGTSDGEQLGSSFGRASRVPEALVEVDNRGRGKSDAEGSSNDDMFADSDDEEGKKRQEKRQGERKKAGEKERLSDSGNTSEEVSSPGPKSSKKSRKRVEKAKRVSSREKSPDHLLLSGDDKDEENKRDKKRKSRSSRSDSDADRKSKRKLSTESSKLSEGRKRNKSEEAKKNKVSSFVDSDASSDGDKSKKAKAVKKKSKALSQDSSDDERISRSNEKKKKAKALVASDVDSSDDDGKLSEADEKKKSKTLSRNSSDDERMSRSNEKKKKVKASTPVASDVDSSDDDGKLVKTVDEKKKSKTLSRNSSHDERMSRSNEKKKRAKALVASDVDSSDEDGNLGEADEKKKSKTLSRNSSDDERMSRSNEKKKKVKASTPVASDVDSSDDDGKLVKTVDEKKKSKTLSRNSSHDERMSRSNEKKKRAKALVASDVDSSDEDGNLGEADEKKKSKTLSRNSSADERMSRSNEKKKKASTPVTSDVDSSDDDGKLAEAPSPQPDSSSEEEVTTNSNDKPRENEEPSAVGENDSIQSVVDSSDGETVKPKKSKDSKSKGDSSPEESEGEEKKKKKKKKAQRRSSLEKSTEKSKEERTSSPGAADAEEVMKKKSGLTSEDSFVTAIETSPPSDKFSRDKDAVGEAPDVEEPAKDSSLDSASSDSGTVTLSQSVESGKKKLTEAEEAAKRDLIKTSSESEHEEETSDKSVKKSKKQSRASSKENSDAEERTERPESPLESPEELEDTIIEGDDKSKRKGSPELSDVDEMAKKILLRSESSSDVAEGLDESEKSDEKRVSDSEERAKKMLLNSDSSSDDREVEESLEKSTSQAPHEETTKDSLLEPDTSSDKVSDDTASKGNEKRAKEALLASNSSLDDLDTSKTEKTAGASDKSGDEVESSAKESDKSRKKEKSKSDSSVAEVGRTSPTQISKPSPKSKKSGPKRAKDLDAEAKKLLLRSSSSSDEDEDKKKKKKLPLKKPATPSDRDSDSMFSSPRVKRRKLNIKNSEFYKTDKKLRMGCSVVVNRLSNNILRRHARALKKSKEYLEDKELKSLTTLDGLEKTRKRDKGNASDSSDTTSTARAKKKTSKEAKDTLVDHLNVNGEKIDTGDSSSSEEDRETREKSQLSGDLQHDAEKLAKSALMESSDEDKPVTLSSDDEPVKKKKDKKKSGKSREKPPEGEGTSSKSSKADWKKSKLLTMKLSSSDEEEQSQKFEKKVQRLSQKDSEDSDFEDDSKKKKRVRRRRLNSDSDIKLTDEEPSNDSEDPRESSKPEKKGKKRSKKGDNSSDSSSSFKSRPKPKRRRVRTAGTDSDSDIEEIANSQGSPNKSGRKNIRKVIKDTKVADDTKQAAKQEEERLKRMAERQKLYNEMYEARLAGEEKVDKLILDFDEESKEELLSVHEGLVKRLKPHQAQGIKFMWDACFESLERAKSTSGSGCILAHCMGLGKSFQAVTLTHTLLVNTEKTGVRTALVVCPLSTVLNWVNEFKIWLNEVNDGDDVEVYELTKFKQNAERRFQLERWQRKGGVIILGYEMYRNLSNPTKKMNKKLRESFFKCLVEPGPDLVICDEGHLLKSETTAISKAMSKIRTLRRIVLTGTPLQNNLTEYHCMVQFVKPNLLGTKKEFLNRFVNPIQNGQFDNSTEYDVKLMKKRAHVLHKMLEGSVQRFDYSVLTPFLPPKQEYVIFVKLSDIQIQLYQYYIDNLARRQRAAGGSLFADFQALQRIWTHPIAIKLNADKAAEKRIREASDSEGSLKDFIDDGSDDESSKSDSTIASTSSSKSKKSDVPVKRHTRANADVEEVVEEPVQEQEWWSQFLQDEHFEDLRISAKLRILFEILKESENIGDKVLVFSQSLYSLTLIERFLATIDNETQNNLDNPSELVDGHTGSWSLGLDYFRLDGQTSTENRSLWCKIFNRPTNTRARLFLISTRAGGLGINLTAANRVVIFDASWNPSHDVQSIFRIYRFGQKKPCYVYRLLAAGTMEEKIYNRQVTKLSLSCRVVDEQQIERHYTHSDLAELYTLDRPPETPETIGCPKDRLLAEIFSKHRDIVVNFHEHDSLLENKADEGLDEEERKQAWLEYEQEKAGRPPVNPMMNMGFNYQDQLLQYNQQMMNTLSNGNAMQMELSNLQRLYQKDFPNMTPEQQKMMATKALMDMYSYMENQAVMSSRVAQPSMVAPAASYSNPTNTLANQLAQEAYTRHHQQAKQMTAYQKQLLYAQQYGNFKSIAGGAQRAPQNASMYRQPPATQGGATASSDPDVLEIIPSTATSNSTAPASSAQSKPSKFQEE
ncbi:transcriptional regulator ATRX [Diachasma alloeum]|uniref:transcriptional regulator ATRX n=1 Tax=Diachasma alloeum TaxID=454923 RepID=UPI0007384E5E|nr:transcriptional regulator ATRX [Diachasma alloeum]